MRHLLAVLAGFALAAPGLAHDDTRIPMPADIPPHHTRFIGGPHHHDIQPEQYESRHVGTHWISYGQHNYDMTGDPSVREDFDHSQHRYRGLGLGEQERYSMTRRSLRDLHAQWGDGGARGRLHAEQPWVLSRNPRRGLAYALPPEEEHAAWERRAVGFPRPSSYAIYKKQKRVVRE